MPEPLRILVVDDEAPARDRLETLLQDLAPTLPNVLVGKVSDGVAALELLAQTAVDVALVDIRMPRMGGIELAGHLGQLPDRPAIVFATAYDQFAVKAFELSAIDYLLKPIRRDRLEIALKKVEAGSAAKGALNAPSSDLLATRGARRFLSCLERGKIVLIPVSDILYLRSEVKYVVARTAAQEFLLDESLLHLEKEFADYFIRIHRSYLVSRNAIINVEKGRGSDSEHWMVNLAGLPEQFAVSRRQWPLVKRFVTRGED